MIQLKGEDIIKFFRLLKKEYKQSWLMKIIVWLCIIATFCYLWFGVLRPLSIRIVSQIKTTEEVKADIITTLDNLLIIEDLLQNSIKSIHADYILFLEIHNSGSGLVGHEKLSHVKISAQSVAQDETKPYIDFYSFVYNIPFVKFDALKNLIKYQFLYIPDLQDSEYFSTNHMFSPYGIKTMFIVGLWHKEETLPYGYLIFLSTEKEKMFNKNKVDYLINSINKIYNYD